MMITVWEFSSAGRASALQAEGHRFEPCCSHQILDSENAGLAHLVERHLAKVEVASSSLVTRSRKSSFFGMSFLFFINKKRRKFSSAFLFKKFAFYSAKAFSL